MAPETIHENDPAPEPAALPDVSAAGMPATGATGTRVVMVVAGEASGDLHAAHLVAAMKKKDPGLFFCGIGGKAMAEAGVRILYDAALVSVVGLTEVVSKLSAILKGLATAKQTLNGLKPDLLILIDFPDFNFRVAGYAKKAGVPVLYYISPQIWAWRTGRVKKIRRLVDHMAVILPFEADFYKQHQVDVSFVGHPLLDEHKSLSTRPPARGVNHPVIALLPGSRDKEVRRLLPEMVNAARILQKSFPTATFSISLAPGVTRSFILEVLGKEPADISYQLAPGGIKKVLEKADFAIAASGTVTLEAAIYMIPMVIVYKVSALSYFLGKMLVKGVSHFGLANLICERRVVPELLQEEVTAETIAKTTEDILKDPKRLADIHSGYCQVRQRLGGPGASQRCADLAFSLMEQNL